MEIAFISANKFQIELQNKQGKFWAKIFSFFNKHPSRFISTMLLGNNISLVVYGMMMALLLEPPMAQFIQSGLVVILLQTLVSTMLILITAEFLPKALFRINPGVMLSTFALPSALAYIVLYPVVFLTTSLADFILKRLFRVKTVKEDVSFGRVDLDNYLREATSNIREDQEIEHEIEIFQNALSFSEIKVRECMVPRTEIVALEVMSPVDELIGMFVETGLSKIMIYRDTIDNIIGYVHSFEMFKKPNHVREVLLPVINVPETMPAQELLLQFTQQHRSVAVIVDEFGGTSGMITIEDVVEEIFGEIDDEHDVDEMVEKVMEENTWEFSARLEIDYLNKEYGLGLPESDDYSTLGGFITHEHESIPEKNEEIVISPFKFTALQVKNNRIEVVRVDKV
jgi:CBS domain containing-hemolysin-like protein